MISNAIELFGYIGVAAFTLCALPQAFMSWKEKHSYGVAPGYLLMWLTGELCMLPYAVYNGLIPLVINYGLNLVFLAVIGYYKLFPQGPFNGWRSPNLSALQDWE